LAGDPGDDEAGEGAAGGGAESGEEGIEEVGGMGRGSIIGDMWRGFGSEIAEEEEDGGGGERDGDQGMALDQLDGVIFFTGDGASGTELDENGLDMLEGEELDFIGSQVTDAEAGIGH